MMTMTKMKVALGEMKIESPCDKCVPDGAYKLRGSSGLISDHFTSVF